MLSTLAILFPNQQIICTLMSLAFAGLKEGLTFVAFCGVNRFKSRHFVN